MRYLLFAFVFSFTSAIFGQEELAVGIPIDEGDGQTFYTCDTSFFDSGGHYIHC